MRQRGLNTYKSMDVILEQTEDRGALWLGDYPAAMNQRLLKQRNVNTVLTIASGLNVKYVNESNIVHKSYPIQDIQSFNIKQIWEDTYQQIEDGLLKGGVLVHCRAGVSRSAATIIAYLIKKKHLTFTEAMQFAKQKRSVVSPNYGFQKQLRQFEKEIMNKEVKEQLVKVEFPQQQMQLDNVNPGQHIDEIAKMKELTNQNNSKHIEK